MTYYVSSGTLNPVTHLHKVHMHNAFYNVTKDWGNCANISISNMKTQQRAVSLKQSSSCSAHVNECASYFHVCNHVTFITIPFRIIIFIITTFIICHSFPISFQAKTNQTNPSHLRLCIFHQSEGLEDFLNIFFDFLCSRGFCFSLVISLIILVFDACHFCQLVFQP